MEEIKEFIKRCNELHEEEKKVIEKHNYDSIWLNKYPDKRRECINRYSKTEKGKYACSKRDATRKGKFKESSMDLEWNEKKLIGRFYKNCPQGYEVDHIIPISRGGKHCLSNLQYLTKEENRKKSAKLDYNK